MVTAPYDILRSGFPYYMTIGQRRVTTNPSDIGFGKENIYVLIRGGLGNGVRVLNWEDENLGIYEASGELGTGAGLLVDEEENLYISDETGHKVIVLDKDGNHIHSWGEYGENPGQLARPSGMSFDPDGNIVLSDTQNNRVQRFTREGKFLQTIGAGDDPDESLSLPWGVTVDNEGSVFVADWENDRIQKYAPDGSFVSTLGSFGSAKGHFNKPSSVAVDKHGDIYVSDRQNDRVQLFNKDGQYIQSFYGNASLSKSGMKYILANKVTLRLRAMGDFEKTQRLDVPVTVRVDDECRLFIMDYGNHRIQIYKKEAVELSETDMAPPMRNPILFTT